MNLFTSFRTGFGDSLTCYKLSWIPGESVGFLIDLFRFFELTMIVVSGREVAVFWSPRKTYMIFYSSRNLPGILSNLHLLLQALVFFFLFINLLYGARLQSMADYLQQVAYSFRGLRGQKPSSQADKDIITVRRDQK